MKQLFVDFGQGKDEKGINEETSYAQTTVRNEVVFLNALTFIFWKDIHSSSVKDNLTKTIWTEEKKSV